METAQVNRKDFTELVIQLERATSIAKAGKYALTTDYTQGLSSEEIENVFDGIAELIQPVKDMLYTINESIDFKDDKKVVIK